ncbi:MAG: hypothetical protein AAGD25_17415 [Cyanobacteria bacterium P01_F01_bin.150]
MGSKSNILFTTQRRSPLQNPKSATQNRAIALSITETAIAPKA